MEQQLDISIYIGIMGDVKQAKEIVADMIKLYYLDGISTFDSKYKVYESFLRKRKMLREYPEWKLLKEHPDCLVQRISTNKNHVFIRSCADLQQYLSPVGLDYAGFFYDVCFAIVRELPMTPMHAESLPLRTFTDHVERTTAKYTGEELVFTKESYSRSQDDDYWKSSASWRMLPRCIAVNGET